MNRTIRTAFILVTWGACSLFASGEPFEHFPRATGMQDAIAALCDDIAVLNINPAGTSAIPKSGLGISYSRLNEEFNIINASYVQKIKPIALGFNMHVNSLAEGFEQLDTLGNSLNSLGEYSRQKYTFNFSTAFSKTFYAGANYSFSMENIGSESYSDSSIDAGMYLKPADWFGAALVVNNLMLSQETELKTSIAFSVNTSQGGAAASQRQGQPQQRGGYAAPGGGYGGESENESEKLEKQIDKDLDLIYTQITRKIKGTSLAQSSEGKINFEVDLGYNFAKSSLTVVTGGFELWFTQNAAVRTGLEYSIYYSSVNFGLGLTAGVGPARLDYAFTVNSLFMSHYVGLQFKI